jgi:hypothetical protein
MTEHTEMNAKWNGEPCRADRGTVICGAVEVPTWWCKQLEGKRVKCVRVNYHGQVFFLGDDDGSGSYKVFETEGGPFCTGHKSLPVDDPTTFEPDTERLVRCIGHGGKNEGCGLVKGKSGGVCLKCGGMLLSPEALTQSELMAERWCREAQSKKHPSKKANEK